MLVLFKIYLSSLGMNIHSRIYLIDILYFSSISPKSNSEFIGLCRPIFQDGVIRVFKVWEKSYAEKCKISVHQGNKTAQGSRLKAYGEGIMR